MVIPIPYGMDYTSTVSGAVLRLVRCEQCAAEYVYRLERSATGSGSSFLFLDNQGASNRASEQAMVELRGRLERGVDLVPCPSCGWYQQHMFPRARREYRRWMFLVGACLTFGLLPLAFLGSIVNAMSGKPPPAISWSVYVAGLAVIAVLGVCLIIGRIILARRYDPNTQDVEIRKQLGRARGLLREHFEKMAKTAQETAAAQESSVEPATARRPPKEESPRLKPVAIQRPGTCPECGVVNPKGSPTCACCGHDL